MSVENRKYYIDNLRWACILLLVPFHSAMAWNSWGEGSYIWFHANRGFLTTELVIRIPIVNMLFGSKGVSTKKKAI